MERLVEEGELVSKDWDKQPYGGIATDSVVVIPVHKGNPLGIKSFKDLDDNEDVEVVTPNPFSSGSARWNIMAIYGSRDRRGQVARRRRWKRSRRCSKRPAPSRAAAATRFSAFTQGEGDVLLTYENEAIKAENEGEDVEYVIPPDTIQIETPIAVTKEAPEPAAEDFLKFLWSDEGQELWAENGYRPVNPKLVDPKQFPTPKDLFKISQVRRLGQGQRRILRRRNRLGREDRGRTRSLHLRLIDGGPRRTTRSSARTPGRHSPARGRRRPRPRRRSSST